MANSIAIQISIQFNVGEKSVQGELDYCCFTAGC